MSSNGEPLQNWHADEEKWWSQYGEYMTYQWQLTPNMNRSLRKEFEEDYKAYLFGSGENLLDLGCGSGWLSVYFAERGMTVLGVDISQEQINAANMLKKERQLANVEFSCSDFMQWDAGKYIRNFEKVFVSAFLHHLPANDLEMIFRKIASVLKPGGRVYMYEPLQRPGKRTFVVKVIDRICNISSRFMLEKLPTRFGWVSARHRKEIERGYTMGSPHERPVNVESLRRFCGNDFEIVETKGWHLNSLGFAMQAMGLKETVRKFYEPIAAFWYWIDGLLIRWFGWEAFSTPQRFILCSVKLVRK